MLKMEEQALCCTTRRIVWWWKEAFVEAINEKKRTKAVITMPSGVLNPMQG
jgi:hypothetical protein